MNKKYAALTFDDGPNVITTPRVLDVLERHKVTASFFLIGDEINEQSAEQVKRACAMGCEICNHSRTHPAMPELSYEQIRDEIQFTSREIEKITGYSPKFFRPPYIAVCREMCEPVGMPFIEGIGCNDWEDTVSACERFERIMAQVSDGDIILLHDMKNNTATVEALEMLIPALVDEGYELVTVSQLFEKCGVEPQMGVIYTNVFAPKTI